MIYDALARLAEQDLDYGRTENGVGFSRVHTELGHSLAKQDPDTWTPQQTRAAYNVIRHYRNTQLPLFGIDFESIPEPEAVPSVMGGAMGPGKTAMLRKIETAATVGPSRIGIDGDRFTFEWPYGEPDFYTKKEAVRAIPGRKWEQDTKRWTAPINGATIEAIGTLVARYADAPSPFEVDDEVYARVDDAAKRLQENIVDSHAADADYEVKGLRPGMNLLPFQRAGVRFMGKHKHVMCGDQMGLGKTPESIATVVDNDAWPVLVISPSSLKLNWQREFRRWVDADLVIQVADGMNEQDATIDPGVDVMIVNYDIVGEYDPKARAWLRRSVKGKRTGNLGWGPALSKVGWNAIICDEAHKLKNHKAQRTKSIRQIVKETRPEHLMLLTGTPFLSRPIEGWTLIDLIGHGTKTFGGWQQFTELYCNRQETRFGLDVSGASNVAQLNQRLRESGAYIRRLKADVMKELPPRRWATVPLEMTASGAKTYLQAQNNLAFYLADLRAQDKDRELAWEQEADLVFAATSPTAPVGPWYDAYIEAKRREYRKSEEARLAQSEQLIRFEALKQLAYEGKKKAVFDWIDDFLESGQKLIVFANHRAVVDEIAARYFAPKIMGGMSAKDVEWSKEQFQEHPNCKVIVCNIQAGGVGHTLTAASDVAFVELGWTPADMDQALDRAHRIGQTESVTGWILAAELPNGVPTIDGEIAEILAKKRAVVDRASDGDGVVEQINVVQELAQRLGSKR